MRVCGRLTTEASAGGDITSPQNLEYNLPPCGEQSLTAEIRKRPQGCGSDEAEGDEDDCGKISRALF